jgi:hypothetical protein
MVALGHHEDQQHRKSESERSAENDRDAQVEAREEDADRQPT